MIGGFRKQKKDREMTRILVPTRVYNQLRDLGGNRSEHVEAALLAERKRKYPRGWSYSIKSEDMTSFSVPLPIALHDLVEQSGGLEFALDAVENYLRDKRPAPVKGKRESGIFHMWW